MMRRAILCGLLLSSCAEPDGSLQPFAHVVRTDSVIASSGDGYDLFSASHARTLSDGRVVVLNAGSQEVLVFSTDGHLERRFGGEGQGPGELTRPQFLGLLDGDSIVVADILPLPQRAMVFRSDGTLARTFELDGPPDGKIWYVFPHGITTDRALVGSLGFEPTSEGESGSVRIPLTVVVYDLDGSLSHVVERPEIFSEFFNIDSDGAPRSFLPPPATHALSASGGSGFVMARGTSRDVLRFGSDAELRTTLRLPQTPALSRSAIDGLRRGWIDEATTDAARALRRRAADDAPVPEAPHVVGDVWIDLLDRTWIREANLEADPLARWLVYDGDALLGYVDMPAELDVREIGADYVLGVLRNDLDVETIVRVQLDVS
jgi:hypothetical protein